MAVWKGNKFWIEQRLRLFLQSQIRKESVELVAKLVEQYTFNVWALGSSPSGFTVNLIKPCKLSIYRALSFKVKWRGCCN